MVAQKLDITYAYCCKPNHCQVFDAVSRLSQKSPNSAQIFLNHCIAVHMQQVARETEFAD